MAALNGYTNFYAVGLQNHGMKLDIFVQPVALAVGLSTTEIQQDGTGMTEPSGLGYAREGCTTSWAVAVATPWANAKVENNANIQFGISTGSWGTITHFAIFDQKPTPDMLWGGALDTPKLIETDTIPIFTATSLSIESVNTTP